MFCFFSMKSQFSRGFIWAPTFFPDPNDIGRPEVARANLGRPSHQRGGSFLNVVSDGGFVVWHRSMEIDGYVGLYGVILILFYPIYWVHPKKTYLYRLCCRSLMSRSTPSLCISHFFDSRVGLRVNCLKGPSKPALVWGYPP